MWSRSVSKVNALAIAPDGSQIAVCDRDGLTILNKEGSLLDSRLHTCNTLAITINRDITVVWQIVSHVSD